MERRHQATECLQGRTVQFSESLIPVDARRSNEIDESDQQILASLASPWVE